MGEGGHSERPCLVRGLREKMSAAKNQLLLSLDLCCCFFRMAGCLAWMFGQAFALAMIPDARFSASKFKVICVGIGSIRDRCWPLNRKQLITLKALP